MAPVAATVANARICAPQQNRRTRELDRALAPTFGSTIVRRARAEDVGSLLALAETLIRGGLASEAAVRRVLEWRPDSVWAFERHGRVVGGLAMLMLSPTGLEALLDGSLDTRVPSRQFLAACSEAPTAIYLWAGAHSSASDGMLKILVRLQSAPYGSANLYAIPVTVSGLRWLERWGFQPVHGHPRKLHEYVRLAHRQH